MTELNIDPELFRELEAGGRALARALAENPGLRTCPGHPVKEGAGYDCCCGACLALPARKAEG